MTLLAPHGFSSPNAIGRRVHDLARRGSVMLATALAVTDATFAQESSSRKA